MCAASVAWRVHMNLCSIRYENGGYISLPVPVKYARYPGMYPNNIEALNERQRGNVKRKRPLAYTNSAYTKY